jgi:hypothetical protein
MGQQGVGAIDAGRADPAQRSMANAGRICGIIGLVIGILSIVVYGIEFAVGFNRGLHGGY